MALQDTGRPRGRFPDVHHHPRRLPDTLLLRFNHAPRSPPPAGSGWRGIRDRVRSTRLPEGASPEHPFGSELAGLRRCLPRDPRDPLARERAFRGRPPLSAVARPRRGHRRGGSSHIPGRSRGRRRAEARAREDRDDRPPLGAGPGSARRVRFASSDGLAFGFGAKRRSPGLLGGARGSRSSYSVASDGPAPAARRHPCSSPIPSAEIT